MSLKEVDQVFPSKILEKNLAHLIAEALRCDYGDQSSAIKEIGRLTGANLRAIKNWYGGKNTPSAAHLLALAQASPSVLHVMLQQIGDERLLQALALPELDKKEDKCAHRKMSPLLKEAEKNFRFRIDLPPRIANQLNPRQLWFLSMLKQGLQGTTTDLCVQWPLITDRTARNDIAKLAKMRLIRPLDGVKAKGYVVI